jgi:hypothetical protein
VSSEKTPLRSLRMCEKQRTSIPRHNHADTHTGSKTQGVAGTHSLTGLMTHGIRIQKRSSYRHVSGFGRRACGSVRVRWWVGMVVRFVCVISVPVCVRAPRVCPVSRLPRFFLQVVLCPVCVPAPPGVFLPGLVCPAPPGVFEQEAGP